MNIDWKKISDAVAFYKNLGYHYVEVPWIVSYDSVAVTTPRWCRHYQLISAVNGFLVGSGEQSFLECRDGLRSLGKKLQCVTPCFRDEGQTTNTLNKRWFVKNELIEILDEGDDPDALVLAVMSQARAFFTQYTYCDVVVTDEGYDLLVEGVEVGSYGWRRYGDFGWVYGTGCAEPRLSMALTKVN